MGQFVSDIGFGRVLRPDGWHVEMWVGKGDTPEHETVDLGLMGAASSKGPGWLRYEQLGVAAKTSQLQFRDSMNATEAALYDAHSTLRKAGWWKAAKDGAVNNWMP